MRISVRMQRGERPRDLRKQQNIHTYTEKKSIMLTTWPSSCWCVSSTSEMCNYRRKEKQKYLYFFFFSSFFFLLLFTRRLWARLLSARTKWDGRTFAVVTFLSADDCSIVVILFFVFRCYVSSSPRNFLDSNSLVYFLKKKKTNNRLARNRVSFGLDLGFIRKI